MIETSSLSLEARDCEASRWILPKTAAWMTASLSRDMLALIAIQVAKLVVWAVQPRFCIHLMDFVCQCRQMDCNPPKYTQRTGAAQRLVGLPADRS